MGKTVLFLAGGQLQAAHGTTAIGDITAVFGRSRLVGGAFAAGMVVLLGLPPFAMFASEVSIAIALADARLAWALGLALVALVVAFAALLRNSGRLLLGTPEAGSPVIRVPVTVAGALVAGVLLSLGLGVTAGPLTDLFAGAASQLGVR
nr:putative hydrogenase HYCQ [Mycolicibacter nonchromogenicus]